jgi:hypothetical protein
VDFAGLFVAGPIKDANCIDEHPMPFSLHPRDAAHRVVIEAKHRDTDICDMVKTSVTGVNRFTDEIRYESSRKRNHQHFKVI